MATKRQSVKAIVDPTGHPITEETREGGFELSNPLPPASFFVDVARMGVQMWIGLAAMTVDGAQKLAMEAVDRGAKIERQGLEKAREFEREQVTYMKDYLRRMKGKAEKEVSGSIEAHVEEALRTHDVPTRDDIRELNQRIAALDAKLAALAAK